MDQAKQSKVNELNLLQDFKTQLDSIPDIHVFSVGSVTVKDKKVETSDSEDTPDTSCNEKMTLLQKACFFHLNEFAQELINRQVGPNQTAEKGAPEKIGTPPILLAAYHGDLKLIKLLHDNGVTLFQNQEKH